MLGYLFVKYQTECRDSIQRSFFVKRPMDGSCFLRARMRSRNCRPDAKQLRIRKSNCEHK